LLKCSYEKENPERILLESELKDMRRNPSFALKVVMLVADLLAIMSAFAMSYMWRVYLDARPFYFAPDIWGFVWTALMLLPLWILVLFVSGVYNESNYLYRGKIYARLFIAALIGAMCVISVAFLLEENIFPSRIVAAYTFGLTFLFLIIEREIIRLVRKTLLKLGKGVTTALVVGNDTTTPALLEQISSNRHFGYQIVAVVANDEFVPSEFRDIKFRSLTAALKNVTPDVIIQTDASDTDKVYGAAIDRHLGYLFAPTQEILLSKMSQLQIVGTQPIINVRATPLIGWARFIKRLQDIIFGGLLLILASPVILLLALISKLLAWSAPVFYSEKRLTRFGHKRRIYKFRTHKEAYNGLTPEQAFAKMGRPELAVAYRANGDKLDNDPRITKLGRFMRTASLDELPQLWNIVKGDISLVGPRALQPGELERYPNRHLILSAKSGLTGLAQVSGRRNISFEERRALDIYYIQNWSLGLDIQIILRTALMVLTRRGAK
jgi:exopolysaccharide biosynthesis polyprenyl glycosylphosphotransferase